MDKRKKTFGKQGILIGVGLLLFLTLFIYFIELLAPGKNVSLGTNVIVSFLFLIGIAFVDYYLVKFVNNTAWFQKRLLLRILFEAIALSVLAVLFVVIGNIPFSYDRDIVAYLDTMIHGDTPVAAILINIFTVVILEFFFQVELSKQREIKLREIQTDNARMQYKQLKGQINPHFLFNSLNVLVSLINKDASRATEYTKKLSEVYRYVLTYDMEDMVTIKEEVDFIRNYTDILKIRFDKGLCVEVDVSDAIMERKIVPMTLQILTENATKHNVVSASKPLIIRIESDMGFIAVSNNLSPRSKTEQSTGIGLKNLSQKYIYLCEQDIVVNNENGEFTVKIPLL